MEQIAALRTQWLTNIAEAIESAQGLAWQLRTAEGASPEARELYGRLEAIRIELQSLRDSGPLFRSLGSGDLLAGLGFGCPVDQREP